MSNASGWPGNQRARRGSLPLLPLLALLFLLAAIALFIAEMLAFSQQQDRLGAGVRVAGVEVGGMRPGEAVSSWEEVYARPLTLWYGESPILLDPATIGFRINSAAMLAEARAASTGGAGNWQRFFSRLLGQSARSAVTIPLEASWQDSLLEAFLNDLRRRYDRPADSGHLDLATLGISRGDGDLTLDIDRASALVAEALRESDAREVRLPLTETAPAPLRLDSLERLIRDWLDVQGFIYDGQTTMASIYIMDLQTGEEIAMNADVAVSAASTIKLPILLDWYRYLTLAPDDDQAFLMANSLLCSNNSSSNLIMQIIGGGENIFRGLSSVTENAQYLGARNTFITAPFDLGVEGQVLGANARPATAPNPDFDTNPDDYNQTTAEDLGTLLGLVYDCARFGSGLIAARPGGEYTRQECRQMLELMSGNNLLRLLQGGLPPGTRVAHKNGWLSDLHGDAGIIFPPNGRDYIISVFVWEDSEFFSFTRAWPLIEGISRAAWNYFSPEAALPAARADLPQDGAAACEDFLPPYGEVNLNDIDSWQQTPMPAAAFVPDAASAP